MLWLDESIFFFLVTKCDEQKSCRNCLQLPECEWCEGTGNEIGRCMNGSADGPYSSAQCPSKDWMFPCGCYRAQVIRK